MIRNLMATTLCKISLLFLIINFQLHSETLKEKFLKFRAYQKENIINEDEGDSAFSISDQINIKKDLKYGDDEKQKMDIYLPENPENAPVLFMVHGGAWRIGNKEMSTVVENKVNHWVPKGFIFISTGYRLLPTTVYHQIEDIAKAVSYAQQHAKSWGGDPSKFILIGHSAGAHLVAYLAADPKFAYKYGAKPWLGTISLDSAALDVVETMNSIHFPLFDNAFGTDQEYWKKTSPFHQLNNTATPFLAICSDKRDISCKQAFKFINRIKSFKIPANVIEENLGHMEINQNLGLPSHYTTSVESFMSQLDPVVKQKLN